MIDHLSAVDLAMVARSGGSLEVDGARYSSTDLAMVARSLQDGRVLVVHNSRSKSATDMAMIARAGSARFA